MRTGPYENGSWADWRHVVDYHRHSLVSIYGGTIGTRTASVPRSPELAIRTRGLRQGHATVSWLLAIAKMFLAVAITTFGTLLGLAVLGWLEH